MSWHTGTAGIVLRAGAVLPSEDWEQLLVADADGMPTLYLQSCAGELWLTEPTTGKLVSVSNAHLRRLGIWSVWLRNVDSRTIVAREGLLQPGSPVGLVREPNTNPAAIAVFAATNRPVGHVSPRIAAGLAPLLDAGNRLRAVVVAFHSGCGTERPGLVKVLVAAPEIIEHLFRRLPGALPSRPEDSVRPARR